MSSVRGRELKHPPQRDEARPAKRRRVEAPPELKEHQGRSSTARPPVKLSLTQPRGPLRRTVVNGVRTDLPVSPDNADATDATRRAEPHQNPAAANATRAVADQKRVLRSQDGGQRLSSDLAHFFPDYEETVFGEQKPPDVLNPHSVLYISDSKDKGASSTLPIRDAPPSKSKAQSSAGTSELPSSGTLGALSNNATTNGAPTGGDFVDLSAYEKEALDFHADPLPDSEFLKAHRRGERNEKQMRNVEKERAMHEKWELERLYDELRGPDWLKTMGISGITETEKKRFEPKRDHFVRCVKALLVKFEQWRENEKELRMKKERAMAAKAEEQEDPEADKAARDEEGFGNEGEDDDEVQDVKEEEEESHNGFDRAVGTTMDAAALQLLQEAQSARHRPTKPKFKSVDPALEQWSSVRPFTSFYHKAHERAAAVGKHRRGRHITAFGHPLPSMPERDFALPEGFLTSDEVRDNARKRRREKRESVANRQS